MYIHSHSIIILPLSIPPNPPIQHPISPSPCPSSPQDLLPPPPKLVTPPASHQHPANHIHHPDQQPQKPFPLLPHGQQYRFDVEFKEDTGDSAFRNGVGLRSSGVLVRDDCVAGAVAGDEGIIRVIERRRRRSRRAGVDCRDDGEVILVLVEVVRGCCVGAVERVEEGRVEGTEGKFINDVGEVECCFIGYFS